MSELKFDLIKEIKDSFELEKKELEESRVFLKEATSEDLEEAEEWFEECTISFNESEETAEIAKGLEGIDEYHKALEELNDSFQNYINSAIHFNGAGYWFAMIADPTEEDEVRFKEEDRESEEWLHQAKERFETAKKNFTSFVNSYFREKSSRKIEWEFYLDYQEETLNSL